MTLQIVARKSLCHFFKIREKIMYGSPKWLMRNRGHLRLLPAPMVTNTEKIAYKSFVQNLTCRNSSFHNPPPRQ